MTQDHTHSLLSSDASVGHWTLDPHKTTVRISHKTMWGLMTVKGAFTDVSGDGEITPDHAIIGTITVGASSIDTKNAKRDKHLRSSEFFHVDDYPYIVVTVKGAALDGEHLALDAELTVRDVHEPTKLTAEVTDLQTTTMAVHVSGDIDRHRFGMSFNQMGMIKAVTHLDVAAVFTLTTN